MQPRLRVLGALAAACLLRPASAADQPYPLWDPSEPIPGASQAGRLEGVEFHVVKRREPEADGYNWLHGAALAWHAGALYASFGHNRGSENTASEEAHAAADMLLDTVNAAIPERTRRFVKLGPAVDGGLARAVAEHLGTYALIIETTRKQPRALRAHQHRLMAHRLLLHLGMVAGDPPADRDGDRADDGVAGMR